MPKLRVGSQAAISLLDSDSVKEWTQALDSYEDSVRRLSQEKGRGGLVDADRWWRTELPLALRSRGPEPYLTKEELVQVVQWKLWMGVVRPNLLRFANETDPDKVTAKSREAFRCIPRSIPATTGLGAAVNAETEHTERVSSAAAKRAVVALTADLKGVGPATASAVLAAFCGGCPFDADEVIDAVTRTGTRKYSLDEYLKVREALDRKASQLGPSWNAERVRKALWSKAMHSRFSLNAEIRVDASARESGAHPAPHSAQKKRVGNGSSRDVEERNAKPRRRASSLPSAKRQRSGR